MSMIRHTDNDKSHYRQSRDSSHSGLKYILLELVLYSIMHKANMILINIWFYYGDQINLASLKSVLKVLISGKKLFAEIFCTFID